MTDLKNQLTGMQNKAKLANAKLFNNMVESIINRLSTDGMVKKQDSFQLGNNLYKSGYTLQFSSLEDLEKANKFLRSLSESKIRDIIAGG